MDKNVYISIYLDKRRAKSSGKYPVKLRVFTSSPRKQKLYPTVFEFTEKEFSNIWLSNKIKIELKPIKMKLQSIEAKAYHVAAELELFDFALFEKKLFRRKGVELNVNHQYEEIIVDLTKNGQLGTASSYELSLKSIMNFVNFEFGSSKPNLLLSDITPDLLKKYERYMVNNLGRSITTVGIYLRPLRAVFNKAIADRDIDSESYPFGKRLYQIPSSRGVKKSLTKDQLKTLYKAKPKSKEQKKAKDFWFFSYACNGMNMKDIALLKYKDLGDDSIVYFRSKIKNTSKGELKPVMVYLTDLSRSVIEEYCNVKKTDETYLFPILDSFDDENAQRRKVQNFTRSVNQHLKKLAVDIGLPKEISTYWARHSFATNAINSGASMEFISEALSHSNLKTTQNYFSGFEQEAKKDLIKNITDFE